jgi:transcriptional regulator with XRE-family HTH domain
MERIGTDARTTGLALGWTQADVARRAGMSQPSISRLEAGDLRLAMSIVTRAFAALGMQLGLKAYPADGIGLRDSGQLALAEQIRTLANPSWGCARLTLVSRKVAPRRLAVARPRSDARRSSFPRSVR